MGVASHSTVAKTGIPPVDVLHFDSNGSGVILGSDMLHTSP